MAVHTGLQQLGHQRATVDKAPHQAQRRSQVQGLVQRCRLLWPSSPVQRQGVHSLKLDALRGMM
jgi:hypothetical protein